MRGGGGGGGESLGSAVGAPDVGGTDGEVEGKLREHEVGRSNRKYLFRKGRWATGSADLRDETRTEERPLGHPIWDHNDLGAVWTRAPGRESHRVWRDGGGSHIRGS